MPYDWNVDHTNRIIRVRGYGEGVTSDTLRLIDEVRDQLRDYADYDFLYDSLELRIQSSPADMMKVANALFREARARFRRFAIVVPTSRVGLARIFAALAHPFGVTANVFDDVESARDWLAVHPVRKPDEPPEPEPESVKH